MRRVIRYFLEGDGTVPKFVEDGGYFIVAEECVGISVDEDKRHVPASVVRMTRADLYARVKTCGFKKPNGDSLTDSECETYVDNFLSNKGMADAD